MVNPQLAREYELVWDRDYNMKTLARKVAQLADYVAEMQRDLARGRVYPEQGSNAAQYAAEVGQAAAVVQAQNKVLAGMQWAAYEVAHAELK